MSDDRVEAQLDYWRDLSWTAIIFGALLAAYPVNSGSSICSVLSDRPRSVAGMYTDGQGALAF